jgi:hypothetical protein
VYIALKYNWLTRSNYAKCLMNIRKERAKYKKNKNTYYKKLKIIHGRNNT